MNAWVQLLGSAWVQLWNSGRYHPDRNPAGREQFQEVAQAYERLQAGAAAGQGPQAWRLLLLLKVPLFYDADMWLLLKWTL